MSLTRIRSICWLATVSVSSMVGAASCDARAPGEETDAIEEGAAPCENLDLAKAIIDANSGHDTYGVHLVWKTHPGVKAADQVVAEVSKQPHDAKYERVMDPRDAGEESGTAHVDKLITDIYVRLALVRKGKTVCTTAPAHLAKPDYADPSQWFRGWMKVVSHVHSTTDDKEEAPGPIHANRINWYNGCFDGPSSDSACHDLLLRSFSTKGLEWAMAAAKDKGIRSVIVTDHDNAGIWYTDTFRKYNVGDPNGPSVVRGMEWTSGLGHMTVIGNFLPGIPAKADVFDLATARLIQTSTPLPEDHCDDTDQNGDVHSPFFDGPDRPCERSDHHGYGDDPITVEQAKASITELRSRGALVYANHPTNHVPSKVPMKWQLENFDLLDGVEALTPSPSLGNEDTPEYWRKKGLQEGHTWVGIAGTDCHIHPDWVYDGDTTCSSMLGFETTSFDAPYMWVKPLVSTSHKARNAPDLIVAALREGRVSTVQDTNPAVVVDLGMDVNGDGTLDFWSGSTVPACEQPKRKKLPVRVFVKPIQKHNYNVSVWRNGHEHKILQDHELQAGAVWTGETEIDRDDDLPDGAQFGYVMVQVRENKSWNLDNDAGFSNPIFFRKRAPGITACNTRDESGD